MDPNEAKIDENAVAYCKYFVDPLNLTGDEIAAEMMNKLNLNDNDNDNDNVYEENVKKDSVMTHALKMQLTRPFDELRKNMVKINDFIYKRIINDGDMSSNLVPLNARVGINYHAYCELNATAFDSTYFKGVTHFFTTGANKIRDGIEAAVLTMRRGEEAQFIISYKLLFGELGCPPRIKPFTDCLYIIKVKSFKYSTEDEKNNFSSIIEKAKQLHSNGMILSKRKDFKTACHSFEKAINLLQCCNLKNEDEKPEKIKVLIKLYTNIAILYNKISLPKRVCSACKEIRKLTNNKPSCKVLYQEGLALITLGDYKFAQKLLRKAQSMEPNCVQIKNDLQALEKRLAKCEEIEKHLNMRALRINEIFNEEDNENKRKLKNLEMKDL